MCPDGGATPTSHRGREGPSDLAFAMDDITKRFPGVVANDQVTFSAQQGEVHALLGENGAGKSTLSNILTGLYQPDAGTIHVRGTEVTLRSPRDALDMGIGMVHQHFRLVRSFTVTENVVLGHERSGSSLWLSPREMELRVEDLMTRYHLPIRPSARLWQLSVGEQQRVEILKALHREATILILDEPTAVLTPGESSALFKTLRQMASDGRTVVFISHKLNEVLEVADRITVLRHGRNVNTLAASETSARELASLMVGRRIELSRRARDEPLQEDPVLQVSDLDALDDLGTPAVRGVSFDVSAGEILGIAGVAGNGQRELVQALAGLRPRASGRIAVANVELPRSDPRAMIEAGMAYVPDDRLGTGLAPGMSIADNLILKSYRRAPVSRGPFLRPRFIRDQAVGILDEYEIRSRDSESPIRLLSGGNVQRVMLAREFAGRPRVLIASSPTQGLDIGATAKVRELLLGAVRAGLAVLLVSEDLDEILDLSDRIGVMYGGRIVGIVQGDEADVEEIGLMMTGASS
jgi:general nucleoside transport system ATP-binding protein